MSFVFAESKPCSSLRTKEEAEEAHARLSASGFVPSWLKRSPSFLLVLFKTQNETLP